MGFNNNAAPLFVFLICFWTLLTIGSIFLAPYLESTITNTYIQDIKPNDISETQKQDNSLWNIVEEIPIVGALVPLMKLATWQYNDKVPVLIVVLLDGMTILSVYVLISIWKK